MQAYDAIAPSTRRPPPLEETVSAPPASQSTAVSEAAARVSAEDVARLAPDLLATARFLVRSEAEARDLVQTTIEIALRRRGQVRDRDRLLPWLLKIQTREAFRLRRRVGRLLSLDARVREVPSASADLEAVAIREALGGLPPRMRAAVVLHHMVGLTVDETAAALNVSDNTVKSQLRVGLQRMREWLR